MSIKRTHILLPEDLVEEIDKFAGARGRSAFLADLARREIKRRRLLAIFQQEEPIWEDRDHPELRAGADKWVRKLRSEAEARLRVSERHRRH